MNKKFLLFLLLFQFLAFNEIAISEVIPLKKPLQSNEIIKKKLLVDVLKPLPKPIKVKEEELKEKESDKKIVSKKTSVQGLLLPKKKPLVAGVSKKNTNLKISKYYNKKDFNIADKAISEMKNAQWSNAIKTAKKAKDKSIYNFVQWRHLLTRGNKASYYEYKSFIDRNENYPRIGRIKYLAEHKLSTDKISPKK